tara:strand:- start:377 stop:1240 length:864 start_codon:yes stop_codon:yes gene_type:complete
VYRKASKNDDFVVAPSGVGYTYPDLGFANATKRCEDFGSETGRIAKSADMSVVNFIASPSRDGVGETPNFDASSGAMDSIMAADEIDAGVWYSFGACYAGAMGNVWWSRGTPQKPIVGGRIALWGDDPSNPNAKFQCTACGVQCVLKELLSRKLQGDPTYASAYTVIPVHVWSHNVSDVVALATALEAVNEVGQPKFEIVTPTELTNRIAKLVTPPARSCPVPTGSYVESCHGCAVGGGGGAANCVLRCSCGHSHGTVTCDLNKCSDLSFKAELFGPGRFWCDGVKC